MIFIVNSLRKKRLVLLKETFLNVLSLFSLFNSIPTCLHSLFDLGIVQDDKPKDVVPRQGEERTDRHRNKYGKGNVFQDMLGDSFGKELCEDMIFISIASMQSIRRDTP